MEAYAFLNYSDYDKLYFEYLFTLCQDGGRIPGKKVVEFFLLSSVQMVPSINNLLQPILREIWNFASVHKEPFLIKEEFFIALKFVALAEAGKDYC